MRITILSAFATLIAVTSYAQVTQDTYIKFYGKAFSQKDSSALATSVLYEKLPYYDDMGMARGSASGSFEFNMIKNLKYILTLKKEGFEDLKQEIEVKDEDGDGIVRHSFYLSPDKELEVITLENLIFARGSDRISPSSYQGLDELTTWLDSRPNMVVQLEGHTDFAGNADANMKLSEARVLAVKEYLVDKGVKKGRLLTKAFGGTQPLSVERTDEAKTRNRRVEVRVISK